MSVHLIVEQAPAAALVRRVERAFAARGRERFSLVLPGGSVATTVFPLLREAALDWARVDLLWGDERLVPLTHADSNYALAKPLLLDFVTPRGARVHPVDAAAPEAWPAGERDRQIDKVLCMTGHRRLHDRPELGPDFRPEFAKRLAEPVGMLVPDDGEIAIVVERDELVTPGDVHRLSGPEHELDCGAQWLRPVLRRSKWRSGPIIGAHESAHFTATIEKGRHALPDGLVHVVR